MSKRNLRKLTMTNLVNEIEPWHEPVDGTEMMEELCKAISHYLILPDGANEAIALWIVHSYVYDAREISPNLVFSSPDKRCGKSTALILLSQLVNKPILASNITPSAIFRVIEEVQPTLIIDEADTFLKNSEHIRGIINSAHNKFTSYVLRSEGDKQLKPRRFSTWSPIVIAGIGKLPDTIEDRSIIIQMRRKLPDESVERLSINNVELQTLSRKIKRWADDNIEDIERLTPTMPAELNDRAADNWETMLAITSVISDDWLDKANRTALILSVDDEDSDASKGTRLLMDIRSVLNNHPGGRISSTMLCEKLNELEEAMWRDSNYGKGMTPNWLASMLAPYGIKSKDIRFGQEVLKGYEADRFNDAFARYLPDEAATTLQSNTGAEPSVADVAPSDGCSPYDFSARAKKTATEL